MKKKLISTTMVISLVANFLFPFSLAKAQTIGPATPTAKVWQDQSNDTIKFIPTEFGTPGDYTVLLSARSGTGTLKYAGVTGSGSNVTENVQMWNVQVNGSTSEGAMFFVATAGYPGDPQKDRATIHNLCFDSTTYESKASYGNDVVKYHFNDTDNSNFVQDYACVEAANIGGDTGAWRDQNLKLFFTPGTPKYQMVNSMMKHYTGGDRTIEPYNRPSAPTGANQTACKDTGTTPILANASDADVDKVIQNIKQMVLANKDNNDDTNTINSFFANTGLRDDLRNADKSAFTTYYAADLTATFPNVPLSEALNLTYIAAANSVAANTPISNDASKYVGTAADILDKAGSVMYGVGIGLSGGGYIGGGAAGLFAHQLIGVTRVKFINDQAVGEMETALKNFTAVYLGAYYIQKNNDYQNCLKSKGDPYAMPNDKMAKSALSILAQSTGVGMSTNTNNPGGTPTNACGAIGFLSVITGNAGLMDIMRSSFCNLALLVNQFAEAFMEGAVIAFNNTVGLGSTSTTGY
jgi:hypothetical protein